MSGNVQVESKIGSNKDVAFTGLSVICSLFNFT